jgi:vacuolar-type H+-ATPase subunit I/STV1
MKKCLMVLIPFIILGLIGGCAKPPVAEMEAAVAALTQAENDPDAAAFAESTLLRARDAVSRMQSEASAKRYDAAKSYAAEAISASEKAISDGRAAATRAREEASSLVTNLKGTLVETENSLDSAKKVPNVNLDFPGLTKDLDAARGTVNQADAAVQSNKPREALEQGRTARAQLSDLNGKISDGVRAASRKK